MVIRSAVVYLSQILDHQRVVHDYWIDDLPIGVSLEKILNGLFFALPEVDRTRRLVRRLVVVGGLVRGIAVILCHELGGTGVANFLHLLKALVLA